MCGLPVPSAMRPDGTPSAVTLLARRTTISRWRLSANVSCRDQIAARRARLSAARLNKEHRHSRPGNSLAVVGAASWDATERRVARARRAADRAGRNDAALPALCASRRQAAEAGLAGKKARAPPSRSRFTLFLKVRSGVVAAVPPPLSIGTLELGDGRGVEGFLVEAEAVAGARDISSFGGWRAFMARRHRRRDHDRSGGTYRRHAVIVYAFSIKLAGSNAPDVSCVTLNGLVENRLRVLQQRQHLPCSAI